MFRILSAILILFPVAGLGEQLAPITKAQKQLLAGQRTQAIETLVAAAKKESSPKVRVKLRQALTALSQEFLTEQGQKSYQVGLSLERSDPVLAIQRYIESQQQENGNYLVTAALIRTQLIAKRCRDAKISATSALVLNPFAADLSELMIRIHMCESDRDAARTELRSLEKEDVTPWKLKWLKALLLISDPSTQMSARSLLEQIRYDSPKFPEAHYYLWRLTKNTVDQKDEYARQYVSLCKSLSAQVRQEFRLEPELCSHVDEVQADIEKQQKHMDEESEKPVRN